MTEADAKTKWCPFTRVALVEGMSANRTAGMGTQGYADITEETRCLGSGCLMWEFRTDLPARNDAAAGKPPHGDCMLKYSGRH